MAHSKKSADPENSNDSLGELPIDMDAVARAEAVVAAFSEEYLGWLSRDLDEIGNLISDAEKDPAAVEKLRRKTHDIRGQGGSFGYPLITEAADGLYRIVGGGKASLSGREMALAREILGAMRFVVECRASGDGDDASRKAVAAAVKRVESGA